MSIEFITIIIASLVYYLIYKNKKIICDKLNIFDFPDDKRKIHKEKTPLIGGILFFSCILIYFFILIYDQKILLDKLTLCICGLILIYFIIGLLDDSINLGAYYKLICLFVATYLILSIEEGLIINKLYFETNNFKISTGYLNIFFTTLCILLLVNALNLADGINSLAVKISLIWLLYIKFIISQNHDFSGLALILVLIIIFFNIYKGVFFLGNSGVMLLSILISILFIKEYNLAIKYRIIYIEEIFILFMVPGVDMFRLFLQRIKNKKDPFKADTNHLHHFLIKKYNLNKALLIYFFLMLAPIFLYKFNFINSVLIIFSYIIIYSIIIYKNLRTNK
tara:strand:- start:149 stop:1159 length:1011 start_codon:yes stop_codon:yes gene_type:complete